MIPEVIHDMQFVWRCCSSSISGNISESVMQRTQPLGRAASYAAVSAFAKAEMREEVLRGYIYPSRNRFNEQFKERAKDTPLFNNQLRSRNLQAQLNMIDHTIIAVPEDKFKECLNLYVKAFRASWIPDEFGEYTAGLGSKLDSSIEDYTLADLWVKGVKEGVTKTHLALRAKGKRPGEDSVTRRLTMQPLLTRIFFFFFSRSRDETVFEIKLQLLCFQPLNSM